MNKFQEIFERISADVIEKVVSDVEIEGLQGILSNTASKLTEDTAKICLNDLRVRLAERREIEKEFIEGNVKRWNSGFDLMEMLYAIRTESGESFYECYGEKNERDVEISMGTVVELHAHSCMLYSEIICLLKNGFPDGALARWRSLHEVYVTTAFISKYGEESAIRYNEHEVVGTYKGMVEYNKHCDSLGYKPFEDSEIAEARQELDILLKRCGSSFKNSYGWTCEFIDQKNPRFGDLALDVDMGHFSPVYGWASRGIHTSIKGVRNKLGLAEAEEEVLLAGRSNSAFTDPAHCASISLSKITAEFFSLDPNIDGAITQMMINEIVDEIGEVFMHLDSGMKKQGGAYE